MSSGGDRAVPRLAESASLTAPGVPVDEFLEEPSLRAALAAPLGLQALAWPGAGTVYRRRHLGLTQLELAPLGLYAASSASLESFIDSAPGRASRVTLNVDPLDSRSDALVARAAAGGWRVLRRETHLLALDRTLDELRRGYHATKRAQVRREPALPWRIDCVRDVWALDAYYGLYTAAAARWGRSGPPYPRRLLEAVLASPAAELWLMHVRERPACAMIVLVSRRFALYWQGASHIDDDQKAAFPMVRLMDTVIGSLLARGVACLNLGASDGLPNVRRFKEEFGARAAGYPTLIHESTVWRALARLRRATG